MNEIETRIQELKYKIQKLEASKGGPKRRDAPVFVGVIKVMDAAVKDYLEYGHSKDIEHYIYEAAASAIYEDWWDWLETLDR